MEENVFLILKREKMNLECINEEIVYTNKYLEKLYEKKNK